ncbi:uncharacterized protein LOC120641236 isoform X3 [Panicum virgatum]|uniref:uncharacterized protein LOC120641236 isoform X3 n=1 Tax=Panicum virgatum TaxID=38727 RepID=UPI0019D57696|nr:uncharacterized protein LOC120641236 isoform X3 [Panicum virgatum]
MGKTCMLICCPCKFPTVRNKESLPLIKICNYLKLIRRHFVFMIEGKQRRRRRENELLCLAKGVWFSMCFCRITSPLSSVPMSRWMGALSTRASGTRQVSVIRLQEIEAEDHIRLRPLCYRGVDVFILSSLVSRKSYENVLKKCPIQHGVIYRHNISIYSTPCIVSRCRYLPAGCAIMSKQVELDEPYK